MYPMTSVFDELSLLWNKYFLKYISEWQLDVHQTFFYSEIRDDCDNIDGVGSDKQSKD